MANRTPQNSDNEIIIGDDGIPGQYQDMGMNDEHNIGLDNNDFTNPDMNSDTVEIENPISQVASAPAKNMLIIGILIIASVFFLYHFFFKESDKVIAEKKLSAEIAAQPVAAAVPPTPPQGTPQVNIGVVETPELPAMDDHMQGLPPPPAVPELPKEVPQALPPADPVQVKIEPTATPAVQEPVQVGAPAPVGPTEEQLQAAAYAREIARRKTGMLVMNGGGTPKDLIDGKLDPTAAGKSAAAQVKATKVDDLGLMILQGKMIDAVLETTLNTDLPGSLRAVISRDIYAESGKTILIPHGSRLLGSYNNDVKRGQQRVIVNWGRVIRPDGVDIDIASSGTDQLGRAGMGGLVDNKYFELFSNSLLVSALTIGGSTLLEGVRTSGAVTQTDTTVAGGSQTSTTATPTDSAILQSVQNLGDLARNLANVGETKPTIIVNQGARIKVFVSKDLIFPASVVNKVSTNN